MTVSERLVRFLGLAFAAILISIASAQADPLAGIRVEPEARVPYDRQRDYGGWIRMHSPYNRCFNVRDQVLADESGKTKFKFEQANGSSWRCTITSGTWLDRYTGSGIVDQRKLDIDHLVPLREAHLSGGHRWSKEQRKAYANYLRDPHHLIAVSLSENRKKGDKDPAGYMPPNAAYQCRYLQHWIAIKRRWGLSMDEAEAAFIRQRIAAC